MSACDNSLKATISTLSLLAATCLVMIIPGVVARAQSLPPSFTDFPMMGVGQFQTLRVNVTNLEPYGCDAVISVYDSNGNQAGSNVNVGSMGGGSGAGKVAMQDFHFTTKFRGEFRPVVTLTPGTASVCYTTAEIYDNFTESSLVFLQGQQPPGPPQQPPGPPSFPGTVGVNLFQTVRLNVVAHPPQPCYGVLSFADVNGNPIGGTSTVSLNSGQAAYLDLPGNTVVTGFGQRAEVQPIFTPAVGSAPGQCSISVEVYNNFTGWTNVILVPPGPPNGA
jgi:hypothetical protein